ncbi:hypothetical protein DYD21_06155 [Rhodohalobacter sp. SW132]|uniref:hypothetical protein n=1 Tax=Rhodohalobacter sp. SW132 TaxID=2293433 RepID=UPI000E244B92|nr:hypothetical protein [Rhodohalobacter sp. SW132]REL38189.1 hypothetical protein DYD21_06155 [Rhodohalobacter sp. SW132]
MNQQDKQIVKLQSMLLSSLIQQTTLPGMSEPIQFPDILHLRNQDIIYVSSENIKADLLRESLPNLEIEILNETMLKSKAVENRDIYYLSLRKPTVTENEIRIISDLKMCPSEKNIPPLSLGAVLIIFQQNSAGEWIVNDSPSAIAM